MNLYLMINVNENENAQFFVNHVSMVTQRYVRNVDKINHQQFEICVKVFVIVASNLNERYTMSIHKQGK